MNEEEQYEYGDQLIYRLVGSTIVAFGANDQGEIFLIAKKGDNREEIIIGKDEAGEITLFEAETSEVKND